MAQASQYCPLELFVTPSHTSGPRLCGRRMGTHVPVRWPLGLLAAVGSWAPGHPVALSHRDPVALGHLSQGEGGHHCEELVGHNGPPCHGK